MSGGAARSPLPAVGLIIALVAVTPPGAATAQDTLGTVWDETESGWTGVWTRRGSSNTFDAVWTLGAQRVQAVLTMYVHGRTITVHRADVGSQLACAYSAILATDGVTVSGGYSCTGSFTGTRPFSATIRRGSSVVQLTPQTGGPTGPVTHGIWGLGVQLGFAEAGALTNASPQLLTQSLTYARDLARAASCVPTAEIEAMLARMRTARTSRPLYDDLTAMRQRYARAVLEGCRCSGSGAQAQEVFATGVDMGIAEHSAYTNASTPFLVRVLTNARGHAAQAGCLPTQPIDDAIATVRRARTGSAAYPAITGMRQAYAPLVTRCPCGGNAAPPQPAVCSPECGRGQVCVNGACVGTGTMRITMTWDNPGDMDLHVVTPAGEEIYYRARQVAGGELDHDDQTGTGPENIFWTANPPPGTYLVCATPYRIRQETRFTITVHRSGRPDQTLTGTRPTGRSGNHRCERGSPDFVAEVAVP